MAIGVGVIAAILAAAAVTVKIRRTDAPQEEPAGERRGTNPPASTAGRTPASTKNIDPLKPLAILPFVDLERDSVSGVWAFHGKSLHTPAVQYGRLQLPCVPPDEYDLTLVATRITGDNSLNIGLPTGDTGLVLVLDGWTRGEFSGIDGLEKKAFFDNPTTFKGHLFNHHAPGKIEVSVRKDRFSVSVNGKPVMSWKPDYSLVAMHPDWSGPEKRAITVGSWESVFRLDEVVITPVGAPLELLK
jgi:hypothetical protein